MLAPEYDPSEPDGQQTVAFNYRVCLTNARDSIRKEMKICARSIVTIGFHLIEVKEECGHGLFLKWLDAEFGWSDRTARRYMQAATVFGDEANWTRVSNLEVTAIHLLAAPSTPEQVREEVLARCDAGEKVPIEEIKDIVRQSAGAIKPKQTKPAEAAAAAPEGIGDANDSDEPPLLFGDAPAAAEAAEHPPNLGRRPRSRSQTR
jgi:Protein of unknown function (DUF3102)